MLKKAFHPKAMMYGANHNNITVVEIQGLYDFVSPIFPFLKRRTSPMFYNFNSTSGNAASVEWLKSPPMITTTQIIFNY